MNKTMKRKVILCITAVVAIAMLYTYVYCFIIGSFASTESIYIRQAKIDDYSIAIKGGTSSSAPCFSGYKLIYKDKVLYIKLKYSLPSPFNKSGDFFIKDSGYFEGVQKAYLQGFQENDRKLIWSKNH